MAVQLYPRRKIFFFIMQRSTRNVKAYILMVFGFAQRARCSYIIFDTLWHFPNTSHCGATKNKTTPASSFCIHVFDYNFPAHTSVAPSNGVGARWLPKCRAAAEFCKSLQRGSVASVGSYRPRWGEMSEYPLKGFKVATARGGWACQ